MSYVTYGALCSVLCYIPVESSRRQNHVMLVDTFNCLAFSVSVPVFQMGAQYLQLKVSESFFPLAMLMG